MVKIVVETGSGSHTTSSASVQVKFVGGPFDGQQLYQHTEFQTGKPIWDNSDRNERWVKTSYELPDGTQIIIIGKGRTGNLGATHWNFQRVYRCDPDAAVQEFEVKVGLRICTMKGRLVLVRDILKEQEAAEKANLEEGF